MVRTRNKSTSPAIDRLLPRLVEVNGCWIFPTVTSSGYGSISVGRRGEGSESAHVVTYQFFIGEIPMGLEPDHLCRVRACCNPWHLELVTRGINIKRGARHNKAVLS
jgi:hypothetical protein